MSACRFTMLGLSLLLVLSCIDMTYASFMTKAQLRVLQREAAQRFTRHADQQTKRQGGGSITFSNPRAASFYVDGTTIPEVEFDVGPSYAGLLPISSDPNETRQLFFWFFPPSAQGSSDDLIFWTNGGPGCSSLEGLLQENGPFSWGWGQAKPTANDFSWTHLANVLYVEQPVGTGFSRGVPNIQDENALAAQLVGFMQQFLSVFSEIKGSNFYVTGESYAGMYVPYIANYIYQHPTALDLSLKGIWISDPAFGWGVIHQQVPAADFVHKYENVFALNQTVMRQIDAKAARCGYSSYVSRFLTYPPRGKLPIPGRSTIADPGCDIWTDIVLAALNINPAFNIFRIFDTFPVLWDVLGFPGTFPQMQTSPVYFNRPDVKAAIHAPADVEWSECADPSVSVFTGPGGADMSPPSAFTVLPSVIEKSARSVIVHGTADFNLIAQGTRITIQNMTWSGKQGFQRPIAQDSFILDGVGALGSMHSERGLTYYEVALAGHMVPQFAPVASFQIMEYLLGRRPSP